MHVSRSTWSARHISRRPLSFCASSTEHFLRFARRNPLTLGTLGLLLGLLPGLLSGLLPGISEVAQAMIRPRILVVPIKGGLDQDSQTAALTRSAVQGLLSSVTVIELRATGVTPTLQACVFKPACIDALLQANRADAVLTGELDAKGEKLLLMVLAPSWPVSYAERQVSSTPARVASEALQVLVMAMGTLLADGGRQDKPASSEEGVVPDLLASGAGVAPSSQQVAKAAAPGADKKGTDKKGAEKKGADKKGGAAGKGKGKKDASQAVPAVQPLPEPVSPPATELDEAATPAGRTASKPKKSTGGSLAESIDEERWSEEASEVPARASAEEPPPTALDEEGVHASSSGKAHTPKTGKKTAPAAEAPAARPSTRKKTPPPALEEEDPGDQDLIDPDDEEATSEELLPEEDPDLEALPEEQAKPTTRKKQPPPVKKSAPKKKKKKALTWPERGEDSQWRGLVLEGAAAGSYGALTTYINSRLSVDAQSVVRRYQWAVRENGAGAFLQLGVAFSLGPYVELGAAGGAFPAQKKLVLYTDYPDPTTDYEAEGNGFDWHLYASGQVKVFPLPALKTRPHLGLSVGWWHVPSFKSSSLASQTHGIPEGFDRLGLEFSTGARFLVAPTVFLSLEGRLLVDPSGYLLKDLSGLTSMDISQLTTPPAAARTIGSVGFGIGFLL